MKIDEILKLSPSQRILLPQQLWDFILDKDIKLSTPIKQELNRRLKAHKNGEMEYFTREELKQKLASEH